jgi:hypothetical protein
MIQGFILWLLRYRYMFCKSVDLIFTFYAVGLRLSTPFFKLQDFRVRLVQLSRAEVDNPLSSHLCPILNTVDHLIIGEYKDPNMYIYWRVRLVQLSRAEVDNPLSSHLCPFLTRWIISSSVSTKIRICIYRY